jgi:hypothetical protein
LVYLKIILLKVVHPLKGYEDTKLHGSTLIGATSVSTSEA